ncbi:MAG: hypothetical protein ACF788_12850 [Novipirellula sp. JB048]
MTNESIYDQATELNCPLGDLRDALHDASRFYRRRDDHDPAYRSQTAWDSPEMAACRRLIATACGDESVDRVLFNGVRFKRLPIPSISWQSARPTPDPYGGNRSHYHTTFVLAGHEVHVDQICRSTSGPGSGVRDCQFFIDGKFVSRGGHAFTVPARLPRGEPAGMLWNDHLLISKQNISNWSAPHASWLVLWKREQGDDFAAPEATEP